MIPNKYTLIPFYNMKNMGFFKKIHFLELNNLKRTYTLNQLFYGKTYNLKRKSIPYNEQYEQHDMVQTKVNINYDNTNIFPEWTMFLHKHEIKN